MTKFLVFIEQRNGQIKKSSFEAAKTASGLASKLGGSVEAVAVGSEISNLESLGGFGVDKVTHLKNETVTNYSPSAYTQAVVKFVSENGFDSILLAASSMGKDLAPRVAAKLDAGLAVDCVALNVEGSNIIATRPVYAGKALVDVKVTSSVKVFALRPNVFSAGTPTDAKAEVAVTIIDSPNLNVKVVEVKKSEGKLDVSEADAIVAGGRGMKGPEHFGMIEELAKLLGAATGASRAVVDSGWRPHSEQVGQTGKVVSPTLYIAVGISGAIQHIAGMRSSKYIVAINKDKDAPIFQIADYGIAGDVFEVLPKFIDEIKKVKS
ncbi:MAG: electron transfer flavoprotein alpha subunit [Ignavibacteria bacterium]|nr:MAG: electron transfer flavoprotein alpha subunit [Ignavibacteria bacterium]KAF0161387.1 MAG: electron transfer flavoprotein alpha subunit [Ignavibacteria bacterium]